MDQDVVGRLSVGMLETTVQVAQRSQYIVAGDVLRYRHGAIIADPDAARCHPRMTCPVAERGIFPRSHDR